MIANITYPVSLKPVRSMEGVCFERFPSYLVRCWVISEQNLNQKYTAEEKLKIIIFSKKIIFFALTKYNIVSASQCITLTKRITTHNS